MIGRHKNISNNPISVQAPLCLVRTKKKRLHHLIEGDLSIPKCWPQMSWMISNVFTWIHALVYCKRSQHKSFISLNTRTRTTSSQQTDKLGPSKSKYFRGWSSNASGQESQRSGCHWLESHGPDSFCSIPPSEIGFRTYYDSLYIFSKYTKTSKHTSNNDQTHEWTHSAWE